MRTRTVVVNGRMQKDYRYERSALPPAPTPRAAALGLRLPQDLKCRPRRPAKKMRPPSGPHRLCQEIKAPLLQLGPVMPPMLVAVHGAAVRALPVLPAASVCWGHCETRYQCEAGDKRSKSLGVERHLTPPDGIRCGPERDLDGPSPARQRHYPRRVPRDRCAPAGPHHQASRSRRPAQPCGSSGSVPFGLPSAAKVSFSTLASACFRSLSQCSFKASPRS